eukprot:10296270-Lingulodinium_polyedra.AAC.1
MRRLHGIAAPGQMEKVMQEYLVGARSCWARGRHRAGPRSIWRIESLGKWRWWHPWCGDPGGKKMSKGRVEDML